MGLKDFKPVPEFLEQQKKIKADYAEILLKREVDLNENFAGYRLVKVTQSADSDQVIAVFQKK